MDGAEEDAGAIRQLILEHFEGMRWDNETPPDWDRFRADFMPCAQLFPAARPAAAKCVEDFIERMEGVAANSLQTFEEHTRKVSVHCFGNVAMAMGMSWMLENGTEENRDISVYLLVKSEGRWQIVAHAWHPMAPGDELPDALK